MMTAVVSQQGLLDSLNKVMPEMSHKVKGDILCAVFGIKKGEARRLIYSSKNE